MTATRHHVAPVPYRSERLPVVYKSEAVDG